MPRTDSPAAPSEVAQSEADSGSTGVRQGSFDWRFEDFPKIKVYWMGSGKRSTARIIMVMHGTSRNAGDYCEAWSDYIADKNAIVVCPHFSEGHFPGTNAYNLGGMLDDSEGQTQPSSWIFRMIEPLFDEIKKRNRSEQTTFDMFGHSAGAQFTHRYVEFANSPHLKRAVAANAGWYTMPTTDARFPYGMKDAPSAQPDFLTRDLTLLLGDADTEQDKNLRQAKQAAAQGETRLERGRSFFQNAQRAAEKSKVSLNWRLQEVPGVGHEYQLMIEAAAQILLK